MIVAVDCHQSLFNYSQITNIKSNPIFKIIDTLIIWTLLIWTSLTVVKLKALYSSWWFSLFTQRELNWIYIWYGYWKLNWRQSYAEFIRSVAEYKRGFELLYFSRGTDVRGNEAFMLFSINRFQSNKIQIQLHSPLYISFFYVVIFTQLHLCSFDFDLNKIYKNLQNVWMLNYFLFLTR